MLIAIDARGVVVVASETKPAVAICARISASLVCPIIAILASKASKVLDDDMVAYGATFCLRCGPPVGADRDPPGPHFRSTTDVAPCDRIAPGKEASVRQVFHPLIEISFRATAEAANRPHVFMITRVGVIVHDSSHFERVSAEQSWRTRWSRQAILPEGMRGVLILPGGSRN